ncbi:MAG: hypothetical protein Q9216_000750 [Gyalolechia sp. 2 TL-2023]
MAHRIGSLTLELGNIGLGGNDVGRVARIDGPARIVLRGIGQRGDVDGSDFEWPLIDAAKDHGLEDIIQAPTVVRERSGSGAGGEKDSDSTLWHLIVRRPVPLTGGQLV